VIHSERQNSRTKNLLFPGGTDTTRALVQRGLLHNAQELVLGDLTVAVAISLINHFLNEQESAEMLFPPRAQEP
jgi:hypothetical protein